MSAFTKKLLGVSVFLISMAWVLVAENAPNPPPSPAEPQPAVAPAEPATPPTTPTQSLPPSSATLTTTDEKPANASVAAEPADAPAVKKADKEETAAPAAPAAPAEKPAKEKPGKKKPRKHAVELSSGSATVVPFGNHTVPAGRKENEVVSLFGSTTVDGEVTDSVVSVFGNTHINGKVHGEAVSVLGNMIINGEVDGEVVAVLGNVHLGPESVVKGEIVCVGGRVIRAPGATTHRDVQEVKPAPVAVAQVGCLADWFTEALGRGRLLWFGGNSGMFWVFALFHLALYALLALLIPSGVEKCVTTFEERPGMSILAALLTFLLTPLVFVLLAITVIGLPVAIAGLLCASVFGRTVMHAWVGRLFLRPFGFVGTRMMLVSAVLVGGVVLSLAYCVPVLALAVHALLGAIGVGVVIYTLILSMKKERKAPLPPRQGPTGGIGAVPPPMPAAPSPVSVPTVGASDAMPMSAASSGFVGTEAGAVAAASQVAPGFGTAGTEAVGAAQSQGFGNQAMPPVNPAAVPMAAAVAPTIVAEPAETLPRAGFWERMGALLVDMLIVSVLVNGLMHIGFSLGLLMSCLAIYGAVLWKLRGTTVGGIIFKLQVVRLDDRPLDWPTTIVRALGCVLSALPVGLGFFWMLFDEDRQTWHDKIAGTIVVKQSTTKPLV